MTTKTPYIQILWFDDCPNHSRAYEMIREVLADLGIDAGVERVRVADDSTARRVRFPGSPTIRVNGEDIEPGYEDCEDCTPRCRVYQTEEGLRGLPPREWIVAALTAP